MIKVITGNEAAAYGALLSRPKVVCAYPITPQSRIPELLSEFCAQGLLDAKFVNAESEMTVLGYVCGASAGGVRVFTATSSQGLAWMHEGLHWAAGARLPIVLVNVNRPLAAPWNLTCDQSDSLSQRDTGWIQFYCESNQDIIDTVIQAYRVSESVGLPSMVCLDGVYLSYLSETVDIPEHEKVDEYLPPYEPAYKALGRSYKLFWTAKPDQSISDPRNYMEARYEQHKAESECIDAVLNANKEFQLLFGRDHPPIEEYKCEDAEFVVIPTGSAVGTGRFVVDRLRKKGLNIGLVKVKLFRPFPRELVRRALSGRKKIIIIERDISPGQGGIFCQEIKWALGNVTGELYGFVSGLGGADITPELIEKAIMFSMQHEPRDEAIWLGLEEREIKDTYDENTIRIP